jgi:hypothetical protein
MKHRKRLFTLPILGLLIITLSSCIGVRADITLRPDGSGTIDLEYRLSRVAESLGKLDGNEGRPTIPLGKADFERTAARVEGLTLGSFSSKNDGKDTINTIKLAFSSLEALTRFLDATGQRASLVKEKGNYHLSLTLTSGSDQLDPDLLTLFTTVSQGYSVSLSLTTPKEGTLSLYDSQGNPLGDLPGITRVPKGKKVSFMSPLGDLFALKGGVGMAFIWEE